MRTSCWREDDEKVVEAFSGTKQEIYFLATSMTPSTTLRRRNNGSFITSWSSRMELKKWNPIDEYMYT
jgi:hypothetical protein